MKIFMKMPSKSVVCSSEKSRINSALCAVIGCVGVEIGNTYLANQLQHANLHLPVCWSESLACGLQMAGAETLNAVTDLGRKFQSVGEGIFQHEGREGSGTEGSPGTGCRPI